MVIEENYIGLELKNIKETFYQEQFYLNIEKFNVYYNKDTELVKLENINTGININNNPTSEDINYLIIQPEDLKTISYLYDERLQITDDNATVFLSFDVLDTNITNNTISVNCFYDTSKISIENMYIGKEVELNYDNIISNLALFITFPVSKSFSTELTFIPNNNNIRLIVVNNTSLFFDIQEKEYQRVNLYGFILPCGSSYTNNRKYYVGYNRKSNQIEQFESYDSLVTFKNLVCYEDEISSSTENLFTLDEMITSSIFKLSENFNASLWNDFYLLYKDKKINTIQL